MNTITINFRFNSDKNHLSNDIGDNSDQYTYTLNKTLVSFSFDRIWSIHVDICDIDTNFLRRAMVTSFTVKVGKTLLNTVNTIKTKTIYTPNVEWIVRFDTIGSEQSMIYGTFATVSIGSATTIVGITLWDKEIRWYNFYSHGESQTHLNGKNRDDQNGGKSWEFHNCSELVY